MVSEFILYSRPVKAISLGLAIGGCLWYNTCDMRSLNSVEYWQELQKKSHDLPQIVFKHSNSCPISLGAFESLKTAEEAGSTPQDIHMLVVQVSPELSEQIESETGITHESPQLLILKDGKVAFHANHYEITGDLLEEKLKELTE